MSDSRVDATGARYGRGDAGDAMIGRRSVLRWGLGAAAAAVAAPALSACGDGGGATASNGKVTLKVMGFQVPPDERGTALDKAYQKFLTDFHAANPNITVDSQQTPPDFDTQIVVDLASGSAPDVWSQDASSLAPLVQRHLLLDMRKVVKAESALDLNRFFPNVLRIHQQKDGSVYALPNDYTSMVCYYNPKLFDKHKVPVPAAGWTWADQLHYAQLLTLDDKGRNRLDPAFDEGNVVQWGYRLESHAYQWVYRLWQNGGDVLAPDFSTAGGYLDSPASLEAIRWYADLVLKHKVAPPPSTLDDMTHASDFDALFKKGKFAMFDSGHWELASLLDAADITAAAPQPKNTQEATVLYESSFAVRYDLPPEKLTAVAKFIEAATSRKYQDTKAITGIAIAANQQSANASLSDGSSKFPEEDKVFVATTAQGRAPYGSRLSTYPTIEKQLDTMMEAILKGAAVEKQVADTIKQVNRELKAQ